MKKLIVGPPGTGKTETCIRIVERELARGVSPSQIAFVAFGKAAASEAAMRAEAVCRHEFSWFRTVHSTAYKLLDLAPGCVMEREHWSEFASLNGYRFTLSPVRGEVHLTPSPVHTPDDQVRALWEWARNTRRTPQEALVASSLRVSPRALQKFIVKFQEFKKARGLVDYIDMIELALPARVGVRVAVVDEAQDLSPLQIEAVENWFRGTERMYIAGDDDQSIYGFQGAEPGWILRLSRTPGVAVEVLRQSRRVPRAVHAFAQSIIARNRNRVSKDYWPRDAEGRVERLALERALRSIDMSRPAFALARNRVFAAAVIAELRRLDLPYWSSVGDVSPMDRNLGVVRAVRAARVLLRGSPLPVGELSALIDRVPTRGVDLIPHGLKSSLADRDPRNVATADEVQALLRGGSLVSVLKTRGVSALLRGRDIEDARYVERILARFGEDFVPKLEVTTIHASKGREAAQVVLLPDMTRGTFAESIDVRKGGRESENRVFYVAATRSYDRLILVEARTRLSFPYPRL